MELQFNKYQSTIEQLNLSSEPQEIQEQFYKFLTGIPYIRELISRNRLYARDIPRDSSGRIIVDITHPHILEDMDYFRPSALHYMEHGCYTFLRPNPNPNSEYGRWIREEVRRCWEGYVRPSDGEWITGDYYFFLNYCPMLISKKIDGSSDASVRVIEFPTVWEGHYYKTHYLEQARRFGRHAAELASRSKGKAHPYSQIVYTPSGVQLWGNIQIGDYLFGDDGVPTRVIDIPFDEVTDIYKVILSDGRTLECSLEHLFKVRDVRKKEQIRIMSLKEIINEDYYHKRKNRKYEAYFSIPVNGKVEFKERKVLIDPYTLGLALGDGCLRANHLNNIQFTSREEDISTYRKYSPYTIDKIKGKYTYMIRIPGVRNFLLEYGLTGKDSSLKFIPEDYKYNTSEVRLAILRGILDTDGTVNNNGIPMLTTTSERLANDVIWLCRSLGYNTRMFKKQGKYYGKICKMTYNISILTNDPVFRLERKLRLLTSFKSNYSVARKNWTHIVRIEYSHRERAKCVTVDNASHCYLIGDFIVTHNSYLGAAMLAKRFLLGESRTVRKRVTSYIVAFDKAKLIGGDQTLDKFLYDIDFCAQNTQFPVKRLINSLQNMTWQSGYMDLDTGAKKGSLNSVVGKALNDASKLRGSRGVLYLFEEAGSFTNLLEAYNNLLPSVEEGSNVFGLLFLYGTAGDNDSDFASMQEIMYHPDGYHVYGIENVYDLEGQGRRRFTFFFPGYLNRANCYDINGNSDVTKALLEILRDRFVTKYNSSDPTSITKKIAEIPVTPQEAILRTRGNIFPINDLTARLNEIDSNPSFYDDVYTGRLQFSANNQVEYYPSSDSPIREYPFKDGSIQADGAVEIYSMPEKNAEGKVFSNRYIAGLDPIEDDMNTGNHSLMSMFVLDLWTDQLVCEWTGRHQYADDCYEEVRKILLFYNARCLFENNKKGLFSYFSRMNCLYLLADSPEYLKDKELIKYSSIGNRIKGYTATLPVNNYANDRIREWLIKPYTMQVTADNGEGEEVTVANLYKIKSRGLLKELILFNPDGNFDRIRALGALMLYREEKMILYKGDMKRDDTLEADYPGNDRFFTENYDMRFNIQPSMPEM